MKYVMMMVSIVAATLSMAGCQSEAMSIATGQSPTVLQSTTGDSTVSAPCTVAPATGGVTISCPNGTSAFVSNGPQGTQGDKGGTGATGASGANGTNGSNGTAGANGAAGSNGTNGSVGATGAVSHYALRNGDGVLVASYLMSYLPSHSEPAFTVWDDTTDSVISWMFNGQPWTETMYFTGANCSGTPYSHKAIAQGLVFASGGSWWKVTSTTVSGIITNSTLSGVTCTNGSLAAATYSAVSAYTNSSVPYVLTLPVRVEKQ